MIDFGNTNVRVYLVKMGFTRQLWLHGTIQGSFRGGRPTGSGPAAPATSSGLEDTLGCLPSRIARRWPGPKLQQWPLGGCGSPQFASGRRQVDGRTVAQSRGPAASSQAPRPPPHVLALLTHRSSDLREKTDCTLENQRGMGG